MKENEMRLDGKTFYRMVAQGARSLYEFRKEIDDLNVFPVPDGDTGDNMYMTISSGVENARDLADCGSLSSVASAVSKGMLTGARGNSGVILSRIFAGWSKGVAGIDVAGEKEIRAALDEAVKEAYSSVSNPVEGTILTVVREGVAAAATTASSLEDGLEIMRAEMSASLDRTPDLLPVLKEAGVVDSGGAGLLCITKGMIEGVRSDVIPELANEGTGDAPKVNLDAFGPDSVLEFGYCTEFILRLQSSKVDLDTFDESVIKNWLESVGDSLVFFRDGSMVKVHVHTKTPGNILNHVQQYGEFLTIKIENMALQHHETTIQNNFQHKRKKYALVAVASGEGLAEAFRKAGADFIVEGGQTMNPSASDFIKAFDQVCAETIFVLPNNSNIIMAARQAAGLYDKSRVIVLESKSVGAGYVAAAAIDYSVKDPDAIAAAASETLGSVTCAMVSRAIRNASKDGVAITEGDYIGFTDGKVVCDAPSIEAAVENLCEGIGAGDSDVAVIFYGSDVTKEDAEALAGRLEKRFPMTEIIMNAGGQPVYNYIITLC